MSYPDYDTPRLQGVLAEVHAERERQDAKWGEQNHPDLTGTAKTKAAARKMWAQFAANYGEINDGGFDLRDTDPRKDWVGILLKEVYEALAETDPAKLRAELVQVAATAVAWIEAIDRRTGGEQL